MNLLSAHRSCKAIMTSPSAWRLCVAVVVSLLRTALHAAPIDVDVQFANGGYTYSYLLTPDPISNYSFADFSLVVPEASGLEEIVVPEAWVNTYRPGANLFFVFSQGGDSDLLPGETATVSFVSRLPPGDQSSSILEVNTSTSDTRLLSVTTLGPRAVRGDYNSNGVVDEADLIAWQSGYGGDDLALDGNGDGIIDAADYTVWRDSLAGSGRLLRNAGVRSADSEGRTQLESNLGWRGVPSHTDLATIPEPASLAVVAIYLAIVAAHPGRGWATVPTVPCVLAARPASPF